MVIVLASLASLAFSASQPQADSEASLRVLARSDPGRAAEVRQRCIVIRSTSEAAYAACVAEQISNGSTQAPMPQTQPNSGSPRTRQRPALDLDALAGPPEGPRVGQLGRGATGTEDLTSERNQSSPRWARRPTPEFPGAAKEAGVTSAVVVLTCRAESEGRLDNCTVRRETRPGFGFGAEALRAAARSRIDPNSTHPGQLFSFSMTFHSEE